jgi:Pacifastin inhibitor (LCMII)
MFRNGCLAISLCAMLATVAVGCGDSTQPQEPVSTERQALTDGIPWWLVEMPTEWGCGETISGRFQGWDSAHMYRFPGKIGYRYDFDFNGSHAARKGIVMAVYDSETGELVASDFETRGNDVGLQYEAEKSVDYFVAVFSIAWTATGDYTLSAGCERTRHCVEWEAADVNGDPLNTFYAKNVGTYDEGKQVLAQVQDFFHEAINPGPCVEQYNICPNEPEDKVCADTPSAQTEYKNVCELKSHIREMAGTDDEWKGQWEAGACDASGQFCGGMEGIPCPDGFGCVPDGAYPDAGGACQRFCTWGDDNYLPGDSFPAGDGCNTCACSDNGMVACTKMACMCNPDVEWWRSYVSTDTDVCAVLKYQCQPKTLPFSNPCGCGCEQDAACPEVIDCEPPTDCSELRSDCPFSLVAN